MLSQCAGLSYCRLIVVHYPLSNFIICQTVLRRRLLLFWPGFRGFVFPVIPEERQRLELEQKIQDVHQQSERAKSMAQLMKQGHVCVISNIGSFDVFKIGMTRRLEPMERVKELSGAAVPFDFDVHAMISCDDAPALEKTLHDHLENYRINRINLRKEFFRAELSRIIDEVERHHGQVEYIVDPVVLQYLQSLEYAESEAA